MKSMMMIAACLFTALTIVQAAAWTVAEFRANAGFAYLPNVLTPTQHEAVIHRVLELKKGSLKAERGSYANGRLGCRLPVDDELSEIFSSPAVLNRVRKASGRSEKLHIPTRDFPIELRAYPVGSEMDWHQDDVLFKEKQLELVYTVENESDSETCWVDARGVTHSMFTEPNSLIVLEAESVRHRVTRLGRGTRTIIKALAVEDGEVLDKEFFNSALGTFGTAKATRTKRKKKR